MRVEHLASHILGRMAARISDDWQRMYGHPIYFLETFVDPERFRGTCYRAANWVLLGKTTGRGKQIQQLCTEPIDQRGSRISADTNGFASCSGTVMKKHPQTPAVDVNLEELDRVLDGARQAPLSEAEYEKVKDALHAMAEMLVRPRNTEKTSAVLDEAEEAGKAASPAGYHAERRPQDTGAMEPRLIAAHRRLSIAHPRLAHGDRCPECGEATYTQQKEPKALVRIVGQAPLAATVYALERLRCGACGQVFTAQAPEGVGPEKYDETAVAMIAQLKYGSGIPFYRLEQLEGQLGIPLAGGNAVGDCGRGCGVAPNRRCDELIRQAAQGEVVHNDDTSMRVLRLAREPSTSARACSPAASSRLRKCARLRCTSPDASMPARTSPRC